MHQPKKGPEMRNYRTKAARNEFVSNWYKTVERWQKDLQKDPS